MRRYRVKLRTVLYFCLTSFTIGLCLGYLVGLMSYTLPYISTCSNSVEYDTTEYYSFFHDVFPDSIQIELIGDTLRITCPMCRGVLLDEELKK